MKRNKAAMQVRKSVLAFILLTVLALAAACSASYSGTIAPPEDVTGNKRTSASPTQEATTATPAGKEKKPITAAPVETVQVDANKISFQYETVSPGWKLIEGVNAQYNCTLVEDGQGVLHLFINDYSLQTYHCFQKADGGWSEPQQIVDASMNWQGYWVGTAPDGSLCFAWKDVERVPVGTMGVEWPTEVIYMKRYKDGQWREDAKSYDFTGASGASTLIIIRFDVAFDAQGEPHFLYSAMGNDPEDGGGIRRSVDGLFLDGTQLTQLDAERQKQSGIVGGVGNLSEFPKLYIDDANVYHLMGCDATSLVYGNYLDGYTRYLHSYSRDGGQTWEGPATVFDGADPIGQISYIADSNRNLHIMAYYPGSDQASLLTTTLRPDSFEGGMLEGYFGSKQMDEDLWELPYEESRLYSSIYFRELLLDSREKQHYLAEGGSWEELFWDMTQINGNTWAIRDIEKPEDGAELIMMFLRRNGNFILLAKATGKIEPELYYTEIPSKL